MTTFGFEAEFQNNANAVIAALHTVGLAGDNRLHGYHCDCEHCEFGNGMAFRGQTDSSCSGEIISDVFGAGAYGDEVALMATLCDAAVEVDAEPGPNSGFHVHVGMGQSYDQLADALWEFVRWEQVLSRIAGGRWASRREGMNTWVYQANSYVFDSHDVRPRRTTSGNVDVYTKRALLDSHSGNDRHSNLNISQRAHPTWEFRIWNSTRSAWRMEMFCGLSVALLDVNVVAGLSELTPPQRFSRLNTGISDVALACANAGHDRTAELLERQSAYLSERAATAPNVLTSL